MAGLADPRELIAQRGDVRYATAADDAGIRALLRSSVMPGAMRLALTREPWYFAGERLAGADDTTVVARQDDRVVGVGRCSVYSWIRNGRPARVGYLGELRVSPDMHAAPQLMREGFSLIADATAELAPDGFVTCIATDNDRARRVLQHGGRFGLPAYRKLGDLVTVALPVATRAVPAAGDASLDVDELTRFLARSANEGQLTLAWKPELWDDLARHGVAPKDFSVVREGGRIVAAGCVWDQRPFKQTVIDGFSGALEATRPIVNALQAMRGQPALPAAGTTLAIGAILGASLSHTRYWPELFLALSRRASQLGLEWLMVTRSARDEQLQAIRRTGGGQEYATSLYEVQWTGGRGFADAWDPRPFRPEVGLL